MEISVLMSEDVDSNAVHGRSRVRIIVSFFVGLLIGLSVGLVTSWTYGAVTGWACACVVYIVWVWLRIWGLNAEQTRAHALREDPGRRIVDIILVFAALTAMIIVVILLVSPHQHQTVQQQIATALLALVSVALSWFLIHTLYTLRYARLYARAEGGVDFNQTDPPQYSDFVYLSFTLGMTFQVSDTNISDSTIRRTIIHHTLLSYLFGTLVVAAMVNLLAGIA